MKLKKDLKILIDKQLERAKPSVLGKKYQGFTSFLKKLEPYHPCRGQISLQKIASNMDDLKTWWVFFAWKFFWKLGEENKIRVEPSLGFKIRTLLFRLKIKIRNWRA